MLRPAHSSPCLLQWVPRWNAVLQSLRSKGEAPRFVPFPGYHLDTQQVRACVQCGTCQCGT